MHKIDNQMMSVEDKKLLAQLKPQNMIKSMFDPKNAKKIDLELLERLREIKTDYCQRSSYKNSVATDQHILLKRFEPKD